MKKTLLFTLILLPMMAVGQNTSVTLSGPTAITEKTIYASKQQVLKLDFKGDVSMAISRLYDDYKMACFADSTEITASYYASDCRHKDCIDQSTEEYRKYLDKKSSKSEVTAISSGYITNLYADPFPYHKCHKKQYRHKEPNFEGFMEYVSKIK